MLKPNPSEVRFSPEPVDGPTGTVIDGVISIRRAEVATDAVYRYNVVYHCGHNLGRQLPAPEVHDPDQIIPTKECPGCRRSVPMQKPVYTCGHENPLTGRKCTFSSESVIATEYHIRDAHTEHCPVCTLLIGSGGGGRGCGCSSK